MNGCGSGESWINGCRRCKTADTDGLNTLPICCQSLRQKDRAETMVQLVKTGVTIDFSEPGFSIEGKPGFWLYRCLIRSKLQQPCLLENQKRGHMNAAVYKVGQVGKWLFMGLSFAVFALRNRYLFYAAAEVRSGAEIWRRTENVVWRVQSAG